MIAEISVALVFFAGDGVDPDLARAAEAAVKARLERHGPAPVDLSAEQRTLTTPPLFADFAAPPPAFLPPELEVPWKAGHDACARRTGPTGADQPPEARAESAAIARMCLGALGQALWDRYLAQRRVERVVEVELRGSEGAGTVSLWLGLHQPASALRWRLVRDSFDTGAAVAVVARATEDLLAGKGVTFLPAPQRPLPTVGLPAVEQGAFGEPAKVAVPASCRGGLPVRLEVFPPEPLTRALEAAYRTVPAERRTGKPKRCDVVVYASDEVQPAWTSARLACGPVQARAIVEAGQGPKLVAKLVENAVAALCPR